MQSRTKTMARKKSNVVYNTIPRSWEWLIINCVVKVIRGVLLGLKKFKGEKLQDDYTKFCKLGTYMAMQKKHGWFFCI